MWDAGVGTYPGASEGLEVPPSSPQIRGIMEYHRKRMQKRENDETDSDSSGHGSATEQNYDDEEYDEEEYEDDAENSGDYVDESFAEYACRRSWLDGASVCADLSAWLREPPAPAMQ